MWLLTSEHATDSVQRGKTYALLLDKEMYDVGREKTNILLTDTSVSRKHAKLYPVSDCVKLEDEKSLFGTFLNNSKKRIPKDEHTFLRDGDLVSFGALPNAWRLSKVDISVITTKLDPRESLELKSLLRILNGNFISSDWSNSVTHLVTSTNVAFTPKFLLALVNCVPVVTWTYFKEAVKVVAETGSLPGVDQFTPTLANFPVECDFRVNESRKTLFDGLIFIFLEERLMAVYQKLVRSAGGTVTLWDKKKPSIIRLASRVIVEGKKQAEQSELNEYLLTKGRRLIPDGEIGLAIAAVSTSEYCNAKYHPGMGHILALETPCVQDCNSSDIMLIEDVPETIFIRDDDEDDGDGDKSALRPGMSKPINISQTEIPETVATGQPSCSAIAVPIVCSSAQFPDDDEDDFNERSQRILEMVDRYSTPALGKRKHSEEEESQSESQQTKKSSTMANESQGSNESQLSRFNSSHFIARPSQKRVASQQSEAITIPPPVTSNKAKRTLADLLAKDDEDSEDEELIFKKKSKVAPSKAVPPKKVIPALLPPVPPLSTAKDTTRGDAVDGPSRVAGSQGEPRLRLSQVTGWLSKKPASQEDCSIKMESLNLDESHAWIGPLMNAIQVKEIKVDLSNFSNNRTANSTISNATTTSNNSSSLRRNYKTFKKQPFLKSCGADYSELTRTKSVLITEKL